METKRKGKKRLAVIDFETDPFLENRIPVPFAWDFYNGDGHFSHWETKAWEKPGECERKLVNLLHNITDSYVIYAHNGGKFDFLYIIDALEGRIKIINGRIVEAFLDIHTLRDSYAILPIPLSASGEKQDIDYRLMERDVRENHKDEIMRYLLADTEALFKLVSAFVDEFGDRLTIGGTAMRELKKFHEYETLSPAMDSQYRQFYYGGRCQCFETGIINTRVEGYDINSSYPDTMKNKIHPMGAECLVKGRIEPKTAFVVWTGANNGAVPVRFPDRLDFTVEDSKDTPKGAFYSTIHEFEAGLETGTIKPRKVLETYNFYQVGSFDDFIDHFYTSRLKAKAEGDKFHEIFYKLILNSAYGKFAQNPENFQDSIILPDGEVPPIVDENEPEKNYAPVVKHQNFIIWGRPSPIKRYLNVATAASITGGSRATLLRGLSAANRPLYCDTDSILCNGFSGTIDSKRLGGWKHEFTGEQIAIAGKKLYAVMGEKDGEFTCLKMASKGVKLNPLAIFYIAKGDTVEAPNPIPTFKLDGKHVFTPRKIKRTA